MAEEDDRTSIACWIEEYNHNWPRRGVKNRTPHLAFLAFATDLKPETDLILTNPPLLLRRLGLFNFLRTNAKLSRRIRSRTVRLHLSP
jgi:hypothetical protein